MNKYHITKKNYIIRAIGTCFLAVMIGLFVFAAFAFDAEGEEVIVDERVATLLLFGPMFLILIIGLSFQWIIMRRHGFYDAGENFIVEKGLIFQKQIKVPYKNINTIAIKRSLLDLILKTAKVEIDSGTTAQPLPEGRLMVSKEYAIVLKDFLENKKYDESLELAGPESFKMVTKTEENIIYKAKAKELFKFGILRQGYLATIIISVLVIMTVLQISYLTSDEMPKLSVFIMGSIAGILGLVALLAVFFGVSYLIVYYGYTLKINGDSLEYEYGFFSKTNFKFNKNKINALYLKQSVGLKAFNYYSLESSIIGIGEYNNDKNNSGYESKYIIPIAKTEKINEVLQMLNKNQLIVDKFNPPTRFKKLNFIYLPLMFLSLPLVVYLGLYFVYFQEFFIVTINVLIAYMIVVGALVLRLKNHGYNIDNDLIVRKGSFTVTKQLVIKQRIQEISYYQGPIYQLLKVGGINFRYKKLMGVVNLEGYTKEEFKTIKEIGK